MGRKEGEQRRRVSISVCGSVVRWLQVVGCWAERTLSSMTLTLHALLTMCLQPHQPGLLANQPRLQPHQSRVLTHQPRLQVGRALCEALC